MIAQSAAAGRARTERRRAVLLALLLALGAAALRFYRLGEWSFWADEVATLRDAQNLSNVRYYPIGYALIGIVVRLVGDSEFAARLLPAIVGAASVPVLFLMGRTLFGIRAGAIAATLLALSSFHIFFSQFARYYTLLMLLAMLGMYCAFLGLERNSVALLVAAVALLALAILTHWSALLLLPALAAYALWLALSGGRPRGWRLRSAAILCGPFVLGGIALAPAALRFVQTWQAPAGFSLARAGILLLKAADRLEPAALICAAVGAWLLLRERDRAAKWLLAWLCLPVLCAATFAGFAQAGRGGSRFILVSLPAVLLLAGALLDQLLALPTAPLRKVAMLLVGLVALSFGLKDALYFTVEMGQRPRWREAAAHVLRPDRHGAGIEVFTNAPEVLQYYAPRLGGPLPVVWVRELDRALTLPPLGKTAEVAVVEMVYNIAPNEERQRILENHFRLERVFPLRVRFLDYSIRVYVR